MGKGWGFSHYKSWRFLYLNLFVGVESKKNSFKGDNLNWVF